MLLNYSDESEKLNPEIRSLMEQAAMAAIEQELGDAISEPGAEPDEHGTEQDEPGAEPDELGAGTHDPGADEADIEIGVTITDDDEIRELNREYRGKDKVTDVLSFPQFGGLDEIIEALEEDEGAGVLLGDVVICYDQAMRQAEEYGTGATRELLYLFVHSLMHLMGYDHEDEEEKKVMRAHEESVLSPVLK